MDSVKETALYKKVMRIALALILDVFDALRAAL